MRIPYRSHNMNRLYSFFKEYGLHDVFLITVVIKGIDGVIETVLGFLLIFTNTFSATVFFLTRDAIIDDPDNYFATHLRAFASQSHHAFVIGGLYLIAHGVLKAFIAGALWRNAPWAYPAAIAFLSLFVFYEVIQIAVSGSIPLMGLALFDIVMIWLVGNEYTRHHQKA
jgi:uncharacterized membrane protein